MKFENIYKETEENMRLALLSLWTPGNHPMRKAVEELLDREPLLAEPVFQSTFGWESADDESWRDAINADVWNRLQQIKQFKPFKHQAESWKSLREGKSIVVTSGTGSGKTECFMYPVLSDLYEQKSRTDGPKAIEAIFLYPLNALMEDQKARLSRYCKATGLKFAVYNGETPEEGRGDNNMPAEIATRYQIRDARTRPEILLTNPSMLEYILVRKADQQMLQESAGRLRWIVIDEAHSYSGSAAVELAYQIKRILDAFGVSADDVRFACTSATIGGEEAAKSLAEFISTIIGQSVDKIKVIGGRRQVPPLDEQQLDATLRTDKLPTTAERIISIRNKINEVAGMTIQQMWEWLCPDVPYDGKNPLAALRLVDRLCEMSQGQVPVLSLRGHFFMRAIDGLYACANEKCGGANSFMPLYGRLTTYRSSVCPECGAPLLEIVQCKRCLSFVLMGSSDSQNHHISQCMSRIGWEDYFSLGVTPDGEEEEDEKAGTGSEDTFFILPYSKEKFFNPVIGAEFLTMDICHNTVYSTLDVNEEDNGRWVEVRDDAQHCFCPDCGRLAQGKRLNFMHFRTPINFVNQTIAPALLQECAPNGSSWGKYIAFTDSRQGTAISAKLFNINEERNKSNQNIVKRLTDRNNVSLQDFSDAIYNDRLFEHLRGGRGNDESAYKAALIRGTIGRRPAYETNAETMGFVCLEFPSLRDVHIAQSPALSDYVDRNRVNLTDQDWQNYLKLAIDYELRLNNHIQPLSDGERKYVWDSNLSRPIASSGDNRTGLARWPKVRRDNNGNVSEKQPRLVLLLCAGLGIHSQEQLSANADMVDAIINEAWNALVRTKILIRVDNDGSGYNGVCCGDRYVGCYYVDLSVDSKVCRIKRLGRAWMCPVTKQLLDTVFCGYSPLIVGRICEKLFDKYRCRETIDMPCRPADDDNVIQWLNNDTNVSGLKKHGYWTDRHKYSYLSAPAYIAAEHSAQQSKDLLRKYVEEFRENRINVLHCSTTMEMGVDIGDVDVVLMDTVPPTAANYLQRVGRAGRNGQCKAIAFSLCSNTPVGQHAFANPMWALQTTNHMIKVRPSQTIIQRHVNSYFFRQYICEQGEGMQTSISVDQFMNEQCEAFVNFLNDISTDSEKQRRFQQVFGKDIPYTVNVAMQLIVNIRKEYNGAINELEDAFHHYQNDRRRQIAISNQRRKLQSLNLLKYLSEQQFIPNANMPIGVVAFDFKDSDKITRLDRLYREKIRLEGAIRQADDVSRCILEQHLSMCCTNISQIEKSTTASRDIRTALNEYAPEQTVVVNERNYVSAGISFLGAYNAETQTRGIYHCPHCGHTEYRTNLAENQQCPVCGTNYRSIIDRDNTSYTMAYEPIGFCTDKNGNATREEKTGKRYYDIQPVLLNTDWNTCVKINMCDVSSSGEAGFILFYNVADGSGFAFCKHCGRAAVDSYNGIPAEVRPGHRRLWGDNYCDADERDIARHVVLTGKHPTCYSVLRFEKEPGSSEYVQDQQLVYSMGVVLKRALAQSEGIDEGEIDFGIKQEQNAWTLFIYDTAKGGCGYSLKFHDPHFCQEIFDLALNTLEQTTCNCHIDGGACARCLIDRSNYKYADKLSKAKILDWLTRQKHGAFEVSDAIRALSPEAKAVYQSLKDIVRHAVNDIEVTGLSLYVSDLSEDCSIAEWTSVHSVMGRCIRDAVTNGKDVRIFVEYHPDLHESLLDRLPFMDLQGKFTDCEITFVEDMGHLKTAVVVESRGKKRRYFTDEQSGLSFSNKWGDNCRIYVDAQDVVVTKQEAPTYTDVSSQVVREGITNENSFQIKNYFTKVIDRLLKDQDRDMIRDILENKGVSIVFNDMYVNSALASLMLVYLIDEMRQLYRFHIDYVCLQLDSSRRKCNNDNFNDNTYIGMNFATKEEADKYTEQLFNEVLGVDPDFSYQPASHHRSLRIKSPDGVLEIRPDHGISGGYRSKSKYMNLETLNGSVRVDRNNEEVLYYVIIKKEKA